jgi:hypothetical protein
LRSPRKSPKWAHIRPFPLAAAAMAASDAQFKGLPPAGRSSTQAIPEKLFSKAP